MNERQKRLVTGMCAEVNREQYWASLMRAGGRLLVNERAHEYADRQRAVSEFVGALFDFGEQNEVEPNSTFEVAEAVRASRLAIGVTHEDVMLHLQGNEDARIQGINLVMDELAEAIHELGYAQIED